MVNPRGSWATNGSITLPTLPSVTSSVNSLHSRGALKVFSNFFKKQGQLRFKLLIGTSCI